MGKKLGAGFIIYGICNMIFSLVMLVTGMPVVGFGGIFWSIISIALGAWMRSSAKRNEQRDELLKRIADNTKPTN